MEDNKKTEQGSVTIEATIALSAFMFAIITILTIVNIAIVQAKISYAINTTAREISQYSYLYSLTGVNQSQGKLYQAGIKDTSNVTEILTDVNTVYNEIQNLGNTGKKSVNNIDDILNAWDGVKTSAGNAYSAGSAAATKIEELAKDPKSLLFGVAKLGASEVFDIAKSRLIAAPIAKALCRRNLVNEDGGDVDSYLKQLGVVPNGAGSYIDSLDFSRSTLFPNGSSEIRITVSYDVKVIPLLPFDFSFHFCQTAVTHGWLAGDVSFQSAKKMVNNKTIWTDTPVDERASYIRHLAINDMLSDGYEKTKGLTDIPLYNPEKNEFAMIASMNPLWSAKGEPTKTLDDISDAAIKEQIERLCGKEDATIGDMSSIKTKKNTDGTTTTTEHDCTDASKKLVIVIPEDEGLKERVEKIIAEANTHGVEVEVIANFGNGARKSEKKDEKTEGNTEN